MENFIPTTSEVNMGVSESLLHAQKIIDAYSKALQDSNCLQSVPIAMYAQADEYQALLEDMSSDISNALSQKVKDVDISTSSAATTTPEDVTTSINSSIKKAFKNDCIDCELPEFKFDADSVLADIWNKIKKFIDDIKGFFNIEMPNFCQFAYMLSFVCIPDLIMILAIILAAILKLAASTLLVSFSIMSFIMGIVGAIISALMKFITALINFGMAPVNCLLDAITSIIDNIPTSHNLKEQLTAEELALLSEAVTLDEDAVDHAGVADRFGKDLKEATQGMADTARKTFEDAAKVIEKAAAQIQEGAEELLGVKDYLTCEPERSGTNLVEKAQALLELIQVANLLMAMIEAKSAAKAVDELCRSESTTSNKAEPMTTDGIASVIASAFNATAKIVESKDEDIAILLTPNDEPSDKPRLSFFECSMNEFIKNAHMDPIITNAVQVAEDSLIGEGLDPRSIKHTRTSIDDIKIADDQQVLLFGQNEETLSGEINKIIEEVLTFNTQNTDEAFAEAVATKLEENTLPEEYIEEAVDIIAENPSSKARARLKDRDSIDLSGDVLSGNIVNKPIQLNCGTIDDLRATLDLLNK